MGHSYSKTKSSTSSTQTSSTSRLSSQTPHNTSSTTTVHFGTSQPLNLKPPSQRLSNDTPISSTARFAAQKVTPSTNKPSSKNITNNTNDSNPISSTSTDQFHLSRINIPNQPSNTRIYSTSLLTGDTKTSPITTSATKPNKSLSTYLPILSSNKEDSDLESDDNFSFSTFSKSNEVANRTSKLSPVLDINSRNPPFTNDVQETVNIKHIKDSKNNSTFTKQFNEENFENKTQRTPKAVLTANSAFPSESSSNTSTSGEASNKKGKPISLGILTKMIKENSPRMLTFLLNCHYNGFINLIHEENLSEDAFKLVFKALKIVCGCNECPQTTSALLQTVVHSDYFRIHVPEYFTYMKEDEVSTIIDATFICNRLFKEFPRGKTSEKFRASLKRICDGIRKLNTQNTMVESSLVILKDIMQSLNDYNDNSKMNKSARNLLEYIGSNDIGIAKGDSFNVCACHIQLLKEEILKHFEMPADVSDDWVKLKVIVDSHDYSPFYGVCYKLRLTADGIIKGRALIPGSLVFLHSTDQSDPLSFIMATVIDVHFKYGIIVVKVHDRDANMAINSNFTLTEKPVLYSDEFLGLLKALDCSKYGDIGFLDMLKPSDMSCLNNSKNSELKEMQMDKMLDESVSVVATFPGNTGVDFGVQFVTAALSKDSTKPILVLCKTDQVLDDLLLKLSPAGNIVRVGGVDSGSLTFTLNNKRRYDVLKSQCSKLFGNRRQLCEKLKRLKKELLEETTALEKSIQTILDKSYLMQFMKPKFKQVFNQENMTTYIWLSQMLPFHGMVKVVNDNPVASFQLSYEPLYDLESDKLLINAESSRRVSKYNKDEFKDAEPELKLTADTSKSEVVSNSTDLPFHDIKQSTLTTLMDANFEDVCLRNPSMLDVQERLKVYACWLRRFRQNKIEAIRILTNKYENCQKQLLEVIKELNYQILLTSEVVGMTTMAAATHYEVLKLLSPSRILILEASNIPEAQILPFIGTNCSWMVLIGHLNGVRPSLNGSMAVASVKSLQVTSILERVTGNGSICYALKEYVAIPPLIGQFLLEENWIKCTKQEFILPSGKIPGILYNVLFLQHQALDTLTGEGLHNIYEANILVGLCRYLCKNIDSSKITIVTVNVCQWLLIKRMVKTSGLQVACVMADYFLSRKNDIILVSLGGEVFDQLYSPSYVTSLLSMAKFVFYCIGNFEKFRNIERSWGKLLNYADSKGFAGGTNSLICLKDCHRKDNVNYVIKYHDFEKMILLKCKKPCGKRLPCGHQCQKECKNKMHTLKCVEKCNKIICSEHSQKCVKLCWETCSKCPDDIIIPQKCCKQLPCGHSCPKLTNEQCESKCKELQHYNGSFCGHKFEVYCYEKDKSATYLSMKCNVDCGRNLACGHLCTGKCGSCRAGKMHVPCQEKCARILVCGHKCEKSCGIDCPPCEKTINSSSCCHRKFYNLCSAEIQPCLQSCGIKCAHTTCTKKCFELCDRQLCNSPCNKKLQCQHFCSGLCGEPCPKICILCDNSSDVEFRSVLLEDCGHSIDVNVMDKLMEEEKTFYGCPICKTPIKICQRYRSVLSKHWQRLNYFRSRYIRGPAANKLVDIDDNYNPFNNMTITEIPNNKFVAARQQMMNEIHDNLNYVSVEVMKIKMSFYELMVCLYQKVNSPLLKNAENQRLVIDHLYKLIKWHRVLNQSSSRQQLTDFLRELRRVAFLTHIYSVTVIPNTPAHIMLCFLIKQLNDSAMLSDNTMEKLNSCVKDLDRLTKTTVTFDGLNKILSHLAVPNIPCMMANHWVKCVNDHWYHIEEGYNEPCDLCVSH